MIINFCLKYLDYSYVTDNIIVKSHNDLDIYFFHFFKKNKLLYIKKMVYDYYYDSFYRISKSVLNSFYENNYKISFLHFIILLTDTYINENRSLIYINTYKDNSFRNFIIGDYYKFLSREYIEYSFQYMYYQTVIGNFYYYNHYITQHEINDIQEQLKTYGKSIELLYML